MGEYYAFITFRVNGYVLKEGDEPGVGRSYINIEGSRRPDFGGSFDADYDENGNPIWQKEDGSLHLMYIVSVDPDQKQLPGKTISIQIEGLGIYPGKADYIPVIDDTWEFEWVLKGTDKSKTYEVNVELGDSKATVTKVELSCFSVRTNMNFHPEMSDRVPVEEENGEIHYEDMWGYPPGFCGVRLKDGTILHPELVTKKMGWLYEGEEMTDHFEEYFVCRNMIDIDQVDAVLYIKENEENEENVCIVPLN